MAQPQTQLPSPETVDLKKASARADLAFLTSGAKEKLSKTVAGMKGAGHRMTHPFNQQAKEDAIEKTVQQKNEIGEKQERIRATAHMQLLQEKVLADGVDPRPAVAPPPVELGDILQNEENGDSPTEPSRPSWPLNESEISHGDDMTSEASSDGSGRARTLSQIPPDSKDYQSESKIRKRPSMPHWQAPQLADTE